MRNINIFNKIKITALFSLCLLLFVWYRWHWGSIIINVRSGSIKQRSIILWSFGILGKCWEIYNSTKIIDSEPHYLKKILYKSKNIQYYESYQSNQDWLNSNKLTHTYHKLTSLKNPCKSPRCFLDMMFRMDIWGEFCTVCVFNHTLTLSFFMNKIYRWS